MCVTWVPVARASTRVTVHKSTASRYRSIPSSRQCSNPAHHYDAWGQRHTRLRVLLHTCQRGGPRGLLSSASLFDDSHLRSRTAEPECKSVSCGGDQVANMAALALQKVDVLPAWCCCVYHHPHSMTACTRVRSHNCSSNAYSAVRTAADSSLPTNTMR
jgi:hypothetical protein